MRKDIAHRLEWMLEEIKLVFKVDVKEKYYISAYSPGDGWTRYRLCEKLDNGGEGHITMNMTHAEMMSFLGAMQDVIYKVFGPIAHKL